MKTKCPPARWVPVWIVSFLLSVANAATAADDRLVGRWVLDEGHQVVEYTFRSDGRYRYDVRSTDPVFDYASTDLGTYDADGAALVLYPYEFLGDPVGKTLQYRIEAGALTLENPEFSLIDVFGFRAGSREEVLAKQSVEQDLVGTWRRRIPFHGLEEYTFRTGGYYFVADLPDDPQMPPTFVRGRYAWENGRLSLRPYNGVEATRETDFFGDEVALVRREPLSGGANLFELVAGSRAVVRAKSAEADAFLATPEWYVGVWEIREPFLDVDVTFRPDGRFVAVHRGEFSNGVVRGRYAMEGRLMDWRPFVGQDIYARSNGDFGKAELTRDVDYYDGELQFVDPTSISQSVRIGRKRTGSEAIVRAKSAEARAERSRKGWEVGVWETQDPRGWMQWVFRPDGRYIAMSGAEGIASQVERGRYLLGSDKLTLAPYTGSGVARGFEIDLYDGEWFVVGDFSRMVVARKTPGSATEVEAKTARPSALEGERGGILGLWTAPLPGYSARRVFREDGEFRLDLCTQGSASRDYGVYTVDMQARRLVLDSRFAPKQTLEMDFYGDTMTIHGGTAAPSTYRVNLGSVEAAIRASHEADAVRAAENAQWLAKVPIAPRDPGVVWSPAGDIPADPFPGRVFESPTVFRDYRLYRRLIPGFVYFNDLGAIKSVAVVHTREWHFFPTGRVLVRFRNYFAGPFYPTTHVEISDTWGAYRIDGKPDRDDVTHRYADNGVVLETDAGEVADMTLEDGRRNLFWDKDYMLLAEWAAEQKPLPCTMPEVSSPELANTGLTLSSSIPADPIPMPGAGPVLLGLERVATGGWVLRGTAPVAGRVVVESTDNLKAPAGWHIVRTNEVSAGNFSIPIANGTASAGYFRLRVP